MRWHQTQVPKLNIREKVAIGATWTVMMRVSIRVIGLISIVILARILTPDDFGIVALAGTLVLALEMLTAFGFETTLIRKRNVSADDYHAVWTLSLCRGVVLMFAIALLGPFAADVFDEPRLTDVFLMIALVPIIQGAANVGVVDFQRNLEFRKEYIVEVATKSVAFASTLVLAFAWKDYWAMIYGTVISEVFRTIVTYIVHPFRPKLTVRGAAPILSFSSWLLVINTMKFAINRSDKFIVGRFTNIATLGEYSLAFEISNLATSELVAPIRRAFLPGFAQVAHNKSMLRQLYLDGFGLVLFIGAPIAGWIAATSSVIVPTVLGDKWLSTIPLLQLLALCGVFRVVTANTNPLLIALGKPKVIALRLALTMTIAIPLLLWLTKLNGAMGAALAVTITAFIAQLLNVTIVKKELEITLWHLLRPIWRSLLATIGMYLLLREFLTIIDLPSHGFVGVAVLLMCALVGLTAYIMIALGTWTIAGRPYGAERLLLDFLANFFRRNGKNA